MSSPITGKTRILGLIADPIVQTRAPGMANGLLLERQKFGDFALLPMHVAAESLAAFVTGLRHLQSFDGAIVSMPHKTAMVKLVDELTPEAKLVGAVNVIRRDSNGRLTGTALDGEGFVAGLKNAGHSVSGAHCLLAGAGGAASSIAFALVKHGCASLCLLNRTQSKADALALSIKQAFPQAIVTATVPPAAQFDILINGTPQGMNAADELPFPASLIERTPLVADCILAPEMTRLLEFAASKGCAIQTGVPMLAAQMDMMFTFMGVS